MKQLFLGCLSQFPPQEQREELLKVVEMLRKHKKLLKEASNATAWGHQRHRCWGPPDLPSNQATNLTYQPGGLSGATNDAKMVMNGSFSMVNDG